MADKDAMAKLQRDKAALELQNQQLREQQVRLCAILDAYEGIICVAGDESSHLYVNRHAEALTGYNRDEFLKLGLPDLLPDDQRDMVVRRFRDRLNGEDVPRVYETDIVQKDGKQIPVEMASTRMIWQDEAASIVFVHDITQRKNTEQALRESEERFRLLAENTQDLICLQNPNGQYIYVSPSCRGLLGYTPEEFSHLPLNRLYHTEDQGMVTSHLEQAAKHGQAVSRLVYRICHKDGRYIWFESDMVPILDEHGHVAHLLTSSRDVTQRKKMEIAFSSRAKELNCLLQITELVELHRGSMEDVMQKVADLLPSSWQHAQVACGRIVVRDRQYTSRNYRRSPGRLGAEITVDEKNVGLVEVCYRRKMPDADEGPFTWEERRLLNAVAERLANIIQRVDAENELKKERQALRESNIAMRELMARIQEEKGEIAQAMQNNVDTVILPILEDLYNSLPTQHRRLIDVLRFNLEEVTSPFVDRVSRAFQNLSPAELRVCDMIRRGLGSKEIAHVLHISPSTVSRHREHIRQKLGLTNKGTNLVSHLNAMMVSRAGNEA